MGSPAVRETIESLWSPWCWRFSLRTFEAEAFVIPTGSMAPTLMGQHKDMICPNCGCPYQVSASGPEDENHNPKDAAVGSATCPMCRFTADLAAHPEQSYSGDRILVGKFCYQFDEPKRWDVSSSTIPAGRSTNYIKRLVGLPGETLRISHGALWIRRNDQPIAAVQIARKPPEKLLAMLQPVFDNDYMPVIRQKNPWPPRWSGAGWKSSDEASFETDGKTPGDAWLRYSHLVPSFDQWQQMANPGGLQPEVMPSLISDFVAYNTGQPPPPRRPNALGLNADFGPREEGEPVAPPRPDALGLNWVGDLALQCTVQLQSAAGQTIVELVKGGRRFRCRINLADGKAELSISGAGGGQFHSKEATTLRGQGPHRLMFANADDQLLLWVDDKLVSFDAPTTYDSRVLGNRVPTPDDLSPVGIAAEGAALRVSHLKIFRNIYYIADSRATQGRYITEYTGEIPDLANPRTWHGFQDVREVEFRLECDQFFAMGDNSAMSSDSRLWSCQNWVDRKLLIGKALFIYWPHSWHKVTLWGHDIPFPYFPNFRKMGLVR